MDDSVHNKRRDTIHHLGVGFAITRRNASNVAASGTSSSSMIGTVMLDMTFFVAVKALATARASAWPTASDLIELRRELVHLCGQSIQGASFSCLRLGKLWTPEFSRAKAVTPLFAATNNVLPFHGRWILVDKFLMLPGGELEPQFVATGETSSDDGGQVVRCKTGSSNVASQFNHLVAKVLNILAWLIDEFQFLGIINELAANGRSTHLLDLGHATAANVIGPPASMSQWLASRSLMRI
jgi:hypothetical protein